MNEYFNQIKSFFTKVNVVEAPFQFYNEMYPYTVSQTINTTYHTKPRRRDPARRWNKTKNYRF
jgi:hypothetical protein